MSEKDTAEPSEGVAEPSKSAAGAPAEGGFETLNEFLEPHRIRDENRFARIETRLEQTASREDMVRLEGKLELAESRLEAKIEQMASREDLARLGARLEARLEQVEARFEHTASQQDLARLEVGLRNLIEEKATTQLRWLVGLILALVVGFGTALISLGIALI